MASAKLHVTSDPLSWYLVGGGLIVLVNFGNVEWFILSEVDVLAGAMSLGFVILGISVRMILSPRFVCFDTRGGYGPMALVFYILD